VASIACGERDGIAFGSSDLEFVAMGMLAIASMQLDEFQNLQLLDFLQICYIPASFLKAL
jgi:hypothetical protein